MKPEKLVPGELYFPHFGSGVGNKILYCFDRDPNGESNEFYEIQLRPSDPIICLENSNKKFIKCLSFTGIVYVRQDLLKP